jgi:hypothetical protein
MPFYFDESIHERGGFILGAYVYGPDPTVAIDTALRSVGMEPGRDEYKSSAPMTEGSVHPELRRELNKILQWTYRYGVVVLPSEERSTLGREALIGLAKICRSNRLDGSPQTAYFDQGIFATAAQVIDWAQDLGLSAHCEVLPEQDSRLVRGLQLADLVAHTCATMLLGTLGLVTKQVKAWPNSGYDPDLDIDLGFELWAGLRHQFFSSGLPDDIRSNEEMVVDVEPYGLHIAEACDASLREAAHRRFAKQYLGCIH